MRGQMSERSRQAVRSGGRGVGRSAEGGRARSEWLGSDSSGLPSVSRELKQVDVKYRSQRKRKQHQDSNHPSQYSTRGLALAGTNRSEPVSKHWERKHAREESRWVKSIRMRGLLQVLVLVFEVRDHVVGAIDCAVKCGVLAQLSVGALSPGGAGRSGCAGSRTLGTGGAQDCGLTTFLR